MCPRLSTPQEGYTHAFLPFQMADAPDVDTLGIRDLKELISSAGLSFEDCLDKADLRARAREAVEVQKNRPPPAGPAPPAGGATRQLGGYPCIVKGPADLLAGEEGAKPADLLIVMLHGLGASNTDLADVPTMLGSYAPPLAAARIVCVFPQAPSSPMGPAWWAFDVMSFMQAQMTPAGPAREAIIAKLIRTTPDGLHACREKMKTLLVEARSIAGGPAGQVSSQTPNRSPAHACRDARLLRLSRRSFRRIACSSPASRSAPSPLSTSACRWKVARGRQVSSS